MNEFWIPVENSEHGQFIRVFVRKDDLQRQRLQPGIMLPIIGILAFEIERDPGLRRRCKLREPRRPRSAPAVADRNELDRNPDERYVL